MRNNTSIQNVKEISKVLLHTVPIQCDNPWGIVQHPFVQHTVAMDRKGNFFNLLVEEDKNKWFSFIEKEIDSADIKTIFYIMVTTPWKLTWLKFVKPYLSSQDFSKFLSDAWTTEDNPNMDVNVSIPEAISWFKEADKKCLMDEEEYKYWESLPDEITLYRGVSTGRAKYGLSWTNDEEIARWFQKRFSVDGSKGQLLKVVASKKNCLCYLDRGEKEIVLDVNAVKREITVIE